jgi:hypothetical protein
VQIHKIGDTKYVLLEDYEKANEKLEDAEKKLAKKHASTKKRPHKQPKGEFIDDVS